MLGDAGDASEQRIIFGAAEKFGISLDAQAVERLRAFIDLLEIWNRRLRLTGERSRDRLLEGHVVDSLSCVPLLPSTGSFLDIGTGAGFPGFVVACVRPDLDAVLLDSRARCVSFLREAIRTLGTSRVRVVGARAEDAWSDPSISRRQDTVVSRALRMDVLVRLARPFLGEAGIIVSMQSGRTTTAIASAVAAANQMRLRDVRDYHLPDGRPRRLVIFESVSR